MFGNINVIGLVFASLNVQFTASWLFTARHTRRWSPEMHAG